MIRFGDNRHFIYADEEAKSGAFRETMQVKDFPRPPLPRSASAVISSQPVASCAFESHRRELGSVVTLVRHFVRDDQMMFSVDRGLNIVTDYACVPAARRHRTCIGISQ
jgi:hypothetical protein